MKATILLLMATLPACAASYDGCVKGNLSPEMAEVPDHAYLNVEFDVHTGSISGVVFEDFDADGARDPGESGLGLQEVFIDANMNGVLDRGEQSQRTGESGEYKFAGLPLNRSYYVQVKTDRKCAATSPVFGYHHVVPTVANPDRTGNDFGIHLPNFWQPDKVPAEKRYSYHNLTSAAGPPEERVRPRGWGADGQSKGAFHRQFIRTANAFRRSLTCLSCALGWRGLDEFS